MKLASIAVTAVTGRVDTMPEEGRVHIALKYARTTETSIPIMDEKSAPLFFLISIRKNPFVM